MVHFLKQEKLFKNVTLKYYLPVIKLALTLCTSLRVIPIEYKKITGKVQLPFSKTSAFIEKAGCTLMFFHAVFCTIRIVQYQLPSNFNQSPYIWKTILEIFFVVTFVAVAFQNISIMIKKHESIHLINATMQLEKDCVGEGKK